MGNPRRIAILLLATLLFAQQLHAEASAADDSTPTDLKFVRKLVMRLPFDGCLQRWDFSPDGKLMAIGNGYTIQLWEVATGKELARVDSEADVVHDLLFVRGGRALIYTGCDGSGLGLLAVPSLACQARIKAACGTPLGMRCSPDGNLLAFGERDDLVLWDLAAGKEYWRNAYPRSARTNNRPVVTAFSPDGRFLAVSLQDGAVALCEIATRKELRRDLLLDHLSALIDYSPTGSFIALGSKNQGKVRLWRPLEGKVFREISWGLQLEQALLLHSLGVQLEPEGVSKLAVSPDGKTIAVVAYDGWLRLWEVATGQLRCRTALRPSLLCRFAPTGHLLATGNKNNSEVCLWEWRRLGGSRARPVTDAELEQAWVELGGDAATAYRAMDRLLDSRREAVAMLRRRLQPAKAIPQADLDRLIATLDDDNFVARERASKRLTALGPVAEKGLRETQEKKRSAEMQKRGRELLAKLLRGLPAEQARELRAVEVLEAVGTPEAGALLQKLADGAPDWPLTDDARAAVERLSHSPPRTR
jgi:WD40 repeat protein